MAKKFSLPLMRRLPRAAATLALVFAGLVTLSSCSRPQDVAPNNQTEKASVDVVGRRIEFKAGGNSESYRTAGWSKTEAEFTWSQGTSATLELPISASPAGLSLKITMAALIHAPELAYQPVEVYANGKKIAEWQVGDSAEFAATIPAEISKRDGVITIEFRTPKAVSPKVLGINADPRVLGICVRSLELSKT